MNHSEKVTALYKKCGDTVKIPGITILGHMVCGDGYLWIDGAEGGLGFQAVV